MKFQQLALFLLLGLVLAAAIPALAPAQPTALPGAGQAAPDFMPLNPDIVQSYQALGRQVPRSSAEARFAGRTNVRINRIERPAALTSTSVKAIVLLVQFTDNPPGGPTTRFRSTVWDSMLFRDNYIRGGADTTTTHTLKHFYNSISHGAVDIVTLDLPSATGWLTAPNNYTYYCEHDGAHDNGFGPYPRNVQRLVMDAVTAADPFVDFSQYAAGGVVQNLFVVHAGSAAEWSGGGDLIWSHAWSITDNDGFGTTPPPLYADGVRVASYSMEPEAGGNTLGERGGAVTGPLLPTVGVYAHEFGHVLGLPDEYDYGYQSNGTGYVSLMAAGGWNRTPNVFPDCAGNSPAQPSAWGMAYLGFVTPTVVTALTAGITIPPSETTGPGAICKVVRPGSGGMEYWLFENRQQLGFDAGFASMGASAHGLCIYHVDENVLARSFWRPNDAECVSGGVYRGQKNCDCDALSANPSNGEKWYGIAVEQADGLYQLELNGSGGWTDFYSSATGVASFTPSTVPNTSSYYTNNDCAGLIAATNIQEVGGDIILDLTADVRTYTLDVTVVGSGSADRAPDLPEYQHGSTVTMQALPGTGHSFAGWSGDTTGSANPITLTMYANKSVTATFVSLAGAGDGPVAALALDPARPSPMRGTGQIGFVLPREARARLGILDLQGREIAVLADGVFPAGRHTATWDGRAERGSAPAGLYFVRLLAEGRVLSQRLVRLR